MNRKIRNKEKTAAELLTNKKSFSNWLTLSTLLSIVLFSVEVAPSNLKTVDMYIL